ncbi:uncharacterized protein ColSpa_12274 [Colletotrichum spaethianum]|uniref:Uncharacterized protein n=1 Tax=Colletotrichum spaethianum TaxID=700344 RepID=A0AA37PH54_9PEZI|nr:uncharacterized protein ColSpa_12274 [Colletotrichum spaethianum]GKT52093.1 hypothetical protein ColSpa_12274 [Colletotrichum spaethianum]
MDVCVSREEAWAFGCLTDSTRTNSDASDASANANANANTNARPADMASAGRSSPPPPPPSVVSAPQRPLDGRNGGPIVNYSKMDGAPG